MIILCIGISTIHWNHGVFCGHSLGKPHGMMEYWNDGILGLKIGKRSILQKMLYLHYIMMPVRHPFSAFAQKNTPLLRENQYNYIRFDSLNPPFHYPLRAVGSTSRRPEPMIPIFQNSNIPIGAKPLTCSMICLPITIQ